MTLAFALFGVYIGKSALSFGRDLDRWASRPSVAFASGGGGATGEGAWVQDCSTVCKQALYARVVDASDERRALPPGTRGTLRVGSLGETREYRWEVHEGALPSRDGGWTLLTLIDPPRNGQASALVTIDDRRDSAPELEFELWAQLCGIEQIVYWTGVGVAGLALIVAVTLASVLAGTRR